MGVTGQRHALAALAPGKRPGKAGWVRGSVCTVRKISPSPGFDPLDRPARSELLNRLSSPDRLWDVHSSCRGTFPGVKRLGRDVEHSAPSGVEVKNEWSYTSTSHYMTSWLVQEQSFL
jgi:hypothetical protein